MIVVEDQLKAIFDYLPSMSYEVRGSSFKPVFGYGDQMELNEFLKSKESDETRPYPLIWLLYPYKELHKKKVVELNDLVLILATNTNAKLSNSERIETNFKRILIPLYDNVFKVLQRAVTVSLIEEVEIIKFPNYSGDNRDDDNQAFSTDLWDAMKTVWNLNINESCLKHIKI